MTRFKKIISIILLGMLLSTLVFAQFSIALADTGDGASPHLECNHSRWDTMCAIDSKEYFPHMDQTKIIRSCVYICRNCSYRYTKTYEQWVPGDQTDLPE